MKGIELHTFQVCGGNNEKALHPISSRTEYICLTAQESRYLLTWENYISIPQGRSVLPEFIFTDL
jgi:hypothetical protein